MNNKDRLELIKSLQKEIRDYEEAKKNITSKIKEKKELLEDITNNVINSLLREEKENEQKKAN